MTTDIWNPREKYTGRGCADPAKSHQEREAELHEMMEIGEGELIIRRLHHDLKGTHRAVKFGVVKPLDSLIDDILKHEYPNA
jgi:hypothetical protein